MELLRRIGEHWLDLVQTIGIVATILFSVQTSRRDKQERKLSNLIALKDQMRAIWKEASERKALSRINKPEVDLQAQPVSEDESIFVRDLILHLDTVHRSIKAGMFVDVEGLPRDVRVFFLNPIPRAVWEHYKQFQNNEFISFVEALMHRKKFVGD